MSYDALELPAHILSEGNVRLGRLEVEEQITVLFAVESGSRAWGFPSPDSDQDVRFVYMRPVGKYVGLDAPIKDTVDCPIDGVWDVSGWDIRKALQLMVKGNATTAEWLSSPLIYREHGPVPFKLRSLLRKHANPAASAKHYYGLTNSSYNKDIAHKVGNVAEACPVEINQKKYLYSLRGALAISWVEKFNTIPPMNMKALMAEDICGWDERSLIRDIVDRKKTMGEFMTGPRIPVLDRFIEARLAWVKLKGMDKLEVSAQFVQEANALLLEALGIGLAREYRHSNHQQQHKSHHDMPQDDTHQ